MSLESVIHSNGVSIDELNMLAADKNRQLREARGRKKHSSPLSNHHQLSTKELIEALRDYVKPEELMSELKRILEETPLKKRTLSQLRATAKYQGINRFGRLPKQQLLEKLKNLQEPIQRKPTKHCSIVLSPEKLLELPLDILSKDQLKTVARIKGYRGFGHRTRESLICFLESKSMV